MRGGCGFPVIRAWQRAEEPGRSKSMQPVRRTSDHVDASQPRPVVSGTDIKVSQIASEYEHLGMTPDDIIEAHAHLTLADVHAALAYYYDHRDAIRREWEEADALIATLRAQYPSRSRPTPQP